MPCFPILCHQKTEQSGKLKYNYYYLHYLIVTAEIQTGNMREMYDMKRGFWAVMQPGTLYTMRLDNFQLCIKTSNMKILIIRRALVIAVICLQLDREPFHTVIIIGRWDFFPPTSFVLLLREHALKRLVSPVLMFPIRGCSSPFTRSPDVMLLQAVAAIELGLSKFSDLIYVSTARGLWL